MQMGRMDGHAEVATAGRAEICNLKHNRATDMKLEKTRLMSGTATGASLIQYVRL